MKSNDYEIEKKYIYTTVYMIFAIIKWAFFILAIVTAAFSLGLLILTLFRGGSIPNQMVIKISGYVSSFYSEIGIAELIKEKGTIHVVMGIINYGLINSINYAMLYVLFSKFIDLFISIMTNKIFTKENVDLLRKLLPLTIVLAFFKPLTLTFIITRYDMFNLGIISLSNIVYIFIVFILFVIFDQGYGLVRKIEKTEKQISDGKIRESELKVETIKKEELIRNLRADIKEVNKEMKKSAEEKVAVKEKKEESPKKKNVKKTPVKKATTKKTTSK